MRRYMDKTNINKSVPCLRTWQRHIGRLNTEGITSLSGRAFTKESFGTCLNEYATFWLVQLIISAYCKYSSKGEFNLNLQFSRFSHVIIIASIYIIASTFLYNFPAVVLLLILVKVLSKCVFSIHEIYMHFLPSALL